MADQNAQPVTVSCTPLAEGRAAVYVEPSTSTVSQRCDVRPKSTCRQRQQPIRRRQRSLSVSPERVVRFNVASMSDRATNHRRSLSEIVEARDVKEKHKYRAPRSRSLDIDLCERSIIPLQLLSHHQREFETANPNLSASPPSLSRKLSLTSPIAWLRRHWMFHRFSDSGILLSDRPTSIMHQDRKMTRSSSVADVDLKQQPFRLANDMRRSNKQQQKQGPNPKRKMLRSHSESAIDLDLLRIVMKHSQSAPCDDDKPAGIICSNDDFNKILTESKRHQFGRKRNNTMVIQLEPTPEVPAEAEIQLDNRLSEKEESSRSPKEMCEVFKERRGSKDKITKLPMRQCVGSNPNSPTRLSDSRRINVRLSPLMLHKNNVNNSSSTGIRGSVHLSPSALASRLSKCNARSDELEPMLPKDKNGNPLIEENRLADDMWSERQNENLLANNDNENDCRPAESAFDPQLLGEAIERHLAMQKQSMSPGRRSPRCVEGRKRSGSLKSILGQNNSQISSRLGNLISRFPFKRDGSVSPTNSDSGVAL